ncbi:hypothetical protein PMZ80_010607 [Knufia obscura]|uniref:Uncharacterized protein n=2 Tax=Knufia TaxID=430999 RepID=A0AAN8F2N0_9EURO|nr:hypothetical protein PMZ80_010607 [Knufia obscura]KAK5955303.1 hypothetical protein OHC33_003985 [Knufia fluminis]
MSTSATTTSIIGDGLTHHNKITFTILFETTTMHTNLGQKVLVPVHYNEFVNMIVRNKMWPPKVSFVSTSSSTGRLTATNWNEVDIPNMIEFLVANDYVVTITDVDTYLVTTTIASTINNTSKNMIARSYRKKYVKKSKK